MNFWRNKIIKSVRNVQNMHGKITASAVTYMLIPSMQTKLTVKQLELGLLKKEDLTSLIVKFSIFLPTLIQGTIQLL